MPKRIAADRDAILASYQETGSGRETARRLDLHENTVYAVLARQRAKCDICGAAVTLGHKHCPECALHIRVRHREKRQEKRRLGICVDCDEPRDPISVLYCTKHRLAAVDRHAAYRVRTRRGAPNQGVPSQSQREEYILKKYGKAGLAVWQRLGGRCGICGVDHLTKSVHVHHLDGVHANNAEENMTCLCFYCHKMVHALTEHPSPALALKWIRKHYPGVLARQQKQLL